MQFECLVGVEDEGRWQLKVYPELPRPRTATVARDLAVLILIGLFLWVGWEVYETVEALTVITSSVVSAGTSVESSLESAARAVDDIPFIGDPLAAALRRSGSGTGGELSELGRQGEERIVRLAQVLGAVVFALPTLLLLYFTLPQRIRQIRQLSAAALLLQGAANPERRRLLAMRAAFSLPYATLLAYTRDPLGDLADDRYDALVAAVLSESGLRVPTQVGGMQE